MRLSVLVEDHAPEKRAVHEMIRERTKAEVADVVLTLDHRPELFGEHFSRWVQDALRGPSEWSEGERELMAAVVSARNQCLF
jgi:hypothetical protein